MRSLQDVILTSCQAAYLCNKRESLPRKLFITVKGVVTALSDVMRVKKDELFVIEVDRCIFILVKDFHLDWHLKIEPGQTYVFHEIRLTTLTKGVSMPSTLYFVWQTSLLTKLSDEQSVSAIDDQEWQTQKSMLGLPSEDEQSIVETEDVEVDDCLSYQGYVTSVEQASDGLFLLDNKIRLFVGPIMSSNGVSLLKKHGQVSVYNAHVFKDKDQLYLVCCVRSFIRNCRTDSDVSDCTDVSSTSDADQVNLRDERQGVLHTLMKYGLNMREIMVALQLHQKLVKQNRSSSDIGRLIGLILKSSLCCNIMKTRDTPVDQFIHHGECCPFVKSKSNICRVPETLDITSLQAEAILQVSRTSFEGHQENSVRGSIRSPTAHRLRFDLNENKMLVGQIKTLSGRTVFHDETGHMHLLILSDDGPAVSGENSSAEFSCDKGEHMNSDSQDKPSKPHSCCQCCFSKWKLGSRPPCPILAPSVLGKTVCVQRFYVVIETYHNTETSSSTDHDTGSDDLIYLVFAIHDCIILDKVHAVLPSSDTCKDEESLGESSTANQKLGDGHNSKTETSVCYVYVSEKQPLMPSLSISSDIAENYFRIMGSKVECTGTTIVFSQHFGGNCEKCRGSTDVGLKTEKESSNYLPCWSNHNMDAAGGSASSDKTNSSENFERSGSPRKIRKIESQLPFDHRTEGNMVSMAVADPVKKHAEKAAFVPENSKVSLPDVKHKESLKENLKPVSISFSQSAAQWFSFIIPGHLYKLSTSDKGPIKDAFVPQFSNKQLQAAAERLSVRMDIEAPEDVIVERLPPVLLDIKANLTDKQWMLPISEILSLKFSETMVSFQGIIVSRTFISTSTFLSSSVTLGNRPSMTNTRLEVREYLSSGGKVKTLGAGVTIYLDSPQVIYCLGLIPGAFVKFCRLEKKVSKQGNVYCRFTHVSMAEVIKFCHLDNMGVDTLERCGQHLSKRLDTKIMDMPKEYLISIWNSSAETSPDENQMWCIHCQLSMFFKLSVKSICSACKMVAFKSQCQNRGCAQPSSLVTAVNAIVLVEDGTCQASVRLRDADLIRRLLTLSLQQWEELVAAAAQDGEIFITKAGYPSVSSPTAEFLSILTDSSMILRPCILVVKMSRDGPRLKNVNEMSLGDFQEKDVKIGRNVVKTFSLPLMQLECLALAERN